MGIICLCIAWVTIFFSFPVYPSNAYGIILYTFQNFELFLWILEEAGTPVNIMILNVSLQISCVLFLLDDFFWALVSERKNSVKTSELTLKTVLPIWGTLLFQLQANAMCIIYKLDDNVNQK